MTIPLPALKHSTAVIAIRAGASIINHAALLLKLKPHFLSIIFPYPAGIKNNAIKQTRPVQNITSTAILNTVNNIFIRVSITSLIFAVNRKAKRRAGVILSFCKHNFQSIKYNFFRIRRLTKSGGGYNGRNFSLLLFAEKKWPDLMTLSRQIYDCVILCGTGTEQKFRAKKYGNSTRFDSQTLHTRQAE